MNETIEAKKVLEEANSIDVVAEKLTDVMTPGFEPEFDPQEAERAGAFVEDALSEADALEAIEGHTEEIIFLDGNEPGEIPGLPFNLKEARDNFGEGLNKGIAASYERFINGSGGN